LKWRKKKRFKDKKVIQNDRNTTGRKKQVKGEFIYMRKSMTDFIIENIGA